MNEDKEKILNKISKLLKVAEKGSGATEAEVQNALKRVEELLKANNLSDSDIPSSETSQQVEVFTEEDMNLNMTLYNWEKFLLHCIADTCLCTMLYSKKAMEYPNADERWDQGLRFYKYVTVVSFCGRPCDIALARYLYKYLRAVVIRETKGMKGTYRDDFARGMVCSLSKQLEQFRVNVNALVPVGLDDWVSKKYPHMKPGHAYHSKSSSAMVDGMRAGEVVNIRRPLPQQAIAAK